MVNRFKYKKLRIAIRWGSILFDFKRLISLRYLPRFIFQLRKYRHLNASEKLSTRDLYPCLSDWTTTTSFDPHYFYQAVWLSKKISDNLPALHIDVGSSINLISILSAFVPTIFIDYRPIMVSPDIFLSVAGDIISLPFCNNSLPSLSCLHVIEHIGLGRYGDPLNPKGTIAAAKELKRVLAKNGTLFISVPIGTPRTEFNAHRIFRPKGIVELFEGITLKSFSFVDDDGNYNESADISQEYDLDYGCGLFEFYKEI